MLVKTFKINVRSIGNTVHSCVCPSSKNDCWWHGVRREFSRRILY